MINTLPHVGQKIFSYKKRQSPLETALMTNAVSVIHDLILICHSPT